MNEQKFLASTDGSRIEQYIIRGKPGFTVTAVDKAERRLPDRATRCAAPQAMGYEYMEISRWHAEARNSRRRSGDEAQGEAASSRANTTWCFIRRICG